MAGYESCTRRQREVIDALISGRGRGNGNLDALASIIGISRRTVKQHLHRAYVSYGIDGNKFNRMVRLVYLRFRELGRLKG